MILKQNRKKEEEEKAMRIMSPLIFEDMNEIKNDFSLKSQEF